MIKDIICRISEGRKVFVKSGFFYLKAKVLSYDEYSITLKLSEELSPVVIYESNILDEYLDVDNDIRLKLNLKFNS